uniref:Uncharacterized protein n=1 Tax=Lactuca sativa TaxID=4236 RepID=A0A9R1V9S0_LACSA|nr:hypothetical protein LSAT_V11C600300170 [Lactuca sativa]
MENGEQPSRKEKGSILNVPQIERSSDTLDMKALRPNTFGLMKQSRKAAKVAYQGLKELVKFGKFVEVEDTPASSSINAEVAEENLAPKPKFQFAFEEIEVSDDEEDQEDQGNELPEKEFENFIQQSILIPKEDVAVTPPSPTPVIQEISSMFTESIPMDQDFESPLVEEEVISLEGAQASRSSFEIPVLDISKGKSKLPYFELVDVVLLQNREIRISELEKQNSDKASKILELQANLGGLTSLFFDLKQCLF